MCCRLDTADVNFSESSQGGREPMFGESLSLTIRDKRRGNDPGENRNVGEEAAK